MTLSGDTKKTFSRFLRAVLAGTTQVESARPTDFGEYAETAEALLGAYKAGGVEAAQRVFDVLAIERPFLHVLAQAPLSAAERKKAGPDLGRFRPLPARVAPALTDELMRSACPWLADYVAFSRRWSPRAFEGFHVGCAAWVLSTVAAGRVVCNLGGLRKTSLIVALTSRSSLAAKSTTAKIAGAVLEASGLDWLLFASDEASPQKFLASLAGSLPANYAQMAEPLQRQVRRALAFAGQKGWYYDEFGQLLAQMARQNGHMTEFRSILRWLDDNKVKHTYSTIARGDTEIYDPYLALMCNMTPSDLKGSARRGAGMWGDGFFARFAFICPPAEQCSSRARFPAGRREVPSALTDPLQDWHLRLGEPEVAVTPAVDKKGNPTGEFAVERATPLPLCEVLYSEAVYQAFYDYGDALLDLVDEFEGDDLNPNYVRFPEKALRLAMLFASSQGLEQIEMPHWQLAVAITEQWRAYLHDLVEQINEPEPGFDEQVEAKIMKVIDRFAQRGRLPQMRDLRQYVNGVGAEQLGRMVAALCKGGMLEEISDGKKKPYYRLPLEQEEALDVSGERETAPV